MRAPSTPARLIETQLAQAGRVARGLLKISERVLGLVQDGMGTDLPDRAMVCYRFIRMAFSMGDRAADCLTDDTVSRLTKAVLGLRHEAHLYTGFVRFSDYRGALVAEIEPKGQVLPLLAAHFAARYPGENFLIFDRTHQAALIHQPGRTALMPVERLELPPTTPEEEQYRRLWRAYHRAVSIEGRENPRCQLTHLAKRYRPMMTEFQEEARPALEGDR